MKTRTIAAVVGVAGLPAAAVAQDAVDVASAFEAEFDPGSADVPGRVLGDRDRVKREPGPHGDPEEGSWVSRWWGGEHGTGHWWGARSDLEERGLIINGSLTFNWSGIWSGGVRERATTRHQWNVNIRADFEKLFGWEGAEVFADFNSSDDRNELNDTGAIQTDSNIDNSKNIDEVGQLWFQQKLFDDVVRLKLGKMDANEEFAFAFAGLEFLNNGAAYPVTVLPMPTIPFQAVGVLLFVYPLERVYVGGGFFDGATQDGIRTGGRGPADFFSDSRSSSWFWIGEAGVGWEIGSMGEGRVAAGVWHHTGDFTRFDLDTEKGTEGWYALAEQQLCRAGDEGEDRVRGLYAFAQYGWADKDLSVAHQTIGGGLVLRGIGSWRPDDSVGFFASFVDVTDDPVVGAETNETAFEVYYNIRVNKFISVRPDVQYIVNPSGRKTIEDAWVGSLQVRFDF
ncbi:MAG: carbohydrate porin [Phycisphaeraceae bacterium]|nr:MAG: carbohydrate porin [Phycisphaeraceae bacterium]